MIGLPFESVDGPQVQVFVLAMPIKSLIAIMMLLFYGSIMMQHATKLLFASEITAGALYQLLKEGEKKSRETPR